VTTKDTGLIMFGVVPDSGTTPGDWVGVNGTLSASGPCRIYLGSVNTKIRWTGCTAYSNGRRVVVPAQAADQTVTLTAGHFTHVCLNTASTNQPQLLDGTSETNNLPTFSTTAPILCLADLKVNGSKITAIYDTRTFTTTTKELVNNITTAAALGMIAQQTATLGAGNSTGAYSGIGKYARGLHCDGRRYDRKHYQRHHSYCRPCIRQG